ncbi:MAG: hypothetical protein Q7S33_02740 [Nanoarchaeota archaeon]|nr:hypothetical protein [Nanoarchaeota archaeon]
MNEQTISIRELRNKITRKKGMGDLEFETIKDFKIQDGKITAGQYIQELSSYGDVMHQNGIYTYCGIRIGFVHSKGGNSDIPADFIDIEAHKEFVKNIFATSPYSLE